MYVLYSMLCVNFVWLYNWGNSGLNGIVLQFYLCYVHEKHDVKAFCIMTRFVTACT
jgi:hypothetical protein